MNEVGISYAIIAAFLRGINKLPIRLSLLEIDESFAATIASLVAMCVFGIPLLLLGWGSSAPPLSSMAIFALVGVVNNGMGRFLIWKSIAAVGANRGNILASTQMIYAVVFAFLFLGDSLTLLLVLGMVLVMLGVVSISYRRGQIAGFTQRQLRRGVVFGLGGAFCWGIGADLMQVGVRQYSNAVGASFLTYSFSLLALVPILFLTNLTTNGNTLRMNRRGLTFAVMGAFFGNIGFYFGYLALVFIPVTVLATINGVNPLITLVASLLLIRNVEFLNKRTILGVLAATLGLFLAAYSI